MLALISHPMAWLIVALIAAAAVLVCLRAIALTLAREITMYDLQVEARKRREDSSQKT